MRTSLFALVTVAALVAACGTSSGGGPSQAARMICADDAQHEISLSIGQTLSRPVAPIWTDNRYACAYVYPVGTITLSVEQLSGHDTAASYYASARAKIGEPVAVPDLGQAAYAESDGSLTVRKDSMVLRVDVHALPTTFGRPTLSRTEAARRVAADIMNCWTGG